MCDVTLQITSCLCIKSINSGRTFVFTVEDGGGQTRNTGSHLPLCIQTMWFRWSLVKMEETVSVCAGSNLSDPSWRLFPLDADAASKYRQTQQLSFYWACPLTLRERAMQWRGEGLTQVALSLICNEMETTTTMKWRTGQSYGNGARHIKIKTNLQNVIQ